MLALSVSTPASGNLITSSRSSRAVTTSVTFSVRCRDFRGSKFSIYGASSSTIATWKSCVGSWAQDSKSCACSEQGSSAVSGQAFLTCCARSSLLLLHACRQAILGSTCPSRASWEARLERDPRGHGISSIHLQNGWMMRKISSRRWRANYVLARREENPLKAFDRGRFGGLCKTCGQSFPCVEHT
ncbi:hypothetical protein VTI74DRAFT_7435 [Chaetomium olivicolor]